MFETTNSGNKTSSGDIGLNISISVRNSCVIKVFGGVFMLSRCFLDCSVGCRGFCYRTESDLFLFLS